MKAEAECLRQSAEVDYLVTDLNRGTLPAAIISLLRGLPACLLALGRLGIPPFPPKEFFSSVLAWGLTSGKIPKKKYDIVYAQWLFPAGLVGLMVSRITSHRPKVVSVICGYDIQRAPPDGGYGIDMWKKVMIKFIMRKSDVVIASHAIHAKIARDIVGQPFSRKVKLLNPGIPDSAKDLPLDSAFARIEGMITEKRPSGVVLYSPSLNPIYGVMDLIRAAPQVVKRLPRTLFVIAGDGSLREKAGQEAKTSGVSDRVLFIGRVPHPAMLGLFRASDVVCDLCYYGQGMTTAEAFCFGKPTIGIMSKKKLITDGENGYLVEAGEPGQVAERVETLLSDELVRERLSNNARTTFERSLRIESRISELTSVFQDTTLTTGR